MRGGDILVGAFFDTTYGNHNTTNRTATGDIRGNGYGISMGGGILLRGDLSEGFFKGLYLESSARAGNLKNSTSAQSFLGNYNIDYNTLYIGLHAGVGYKSKINETLEFDIYGKYFWSSINRKDISALGDVFNLGNTNSMRSRLGGRLSYTKLEYFTPYIGGAWEHELDGETPATIYGFNVSAPSLKGSSRMGEAGLIWIPQDSRDLMLNFNFQRFIGKRQGIAWNAMFSVKF